MKIEENAVRTTYQNEHDFSLMDEGGKSMPQSLRKFKALQSFSQEKRKPSGYGQQNLKDIINS
ncbi:hypothetical protein P8881_19475 [Bacillus haynesii]|uniref:hypothetical protein n=1 Tax=Bacillus haynesii TaxID=1925021 RepID=UPI002280B953|nr:hypothetical protein [Bacillus haynesii]MCY8737515.1 hypothetical protein [Bacillus haynesii]MEC0709707.1 hypothetical protein [Bacillus haynesii]MEC0736914.1 hypothetical protein [Bacillus haynesii]